MLICPDLFSIFRVQGNSVAVLNFRTSERHNESHGILDLEEINLNDRETGSGNPGRKFLKKNDSWIHTPRCFH